MRTSLTIHYAVNGTTKTDVVAGTRPSIQRFGSVLEISFPEGDGEVLVWGVSNAPTNGLLGLSYARADRLVVMPEPRS